MSLGLSHSLSRYKLKFSPDKVDTMIVQVRAREAAARAGAR
jgi:RNA processing factor Prp31